MLYETDGLIDQTFAEYGDAFERDYILAGWSQTSQYNGALKTLDQNVEYLREWLKERNEWLYQCWDCENITVDYTDYYKAVELTRGLSETNYSNYDEIKELLEKGLPAEATQKDINKATEMLLSAIEAGERIVVGEEKIVQFEFEPGKELDQSELSKEVLANSGSISENSILRASLNGKDSKKLKYSNDNLYLDNGRYITTPILKAKSDVNDLKPWTEEACFVVKSSTTSYKNIVFSATLGATKKGAKDFCLQYSIDGENYFDIEDSQQSLTQNKTMTKLYSRFVLPKECEDQDILYIKVKLASNKTVAAEDIIFGETTSGEVAINHVSLAGEKIPHNFSHVEAKDVTCTTDGNIEYWYCIDCGQYFSNEKATYRIYERDLTIPLLGHSYKTIVTPPACTVSGNTLYECDNCEDSYIDDYTSPLGHSYKNYISDGNANCTADGTKTAKCERCDSKNTIVDSGSKLGHAWNKGEITKEATIEATGVKTYKCTRCSETKTEIIPKLKIDKPANDNKDDSEDNKPTGDVKVPEKQEEVTSGYVFTDVKAKADFKVIKSADGVKQVEYAVSKDKNAKSITIPNEITIAGEKYVVTKIAKGAFKKNTKVTSVTIGKNVTVIGDSAFADCTKLASIKVKSGSKLTTIKDNAFKNCKSLKKVTIPKTVTKIGKKAFYNCKKLKTVTINTKKLKSVGASAFKNMAKKSTIKLPKGKVKAYKKLLAKKYTVSRTKLN